MAARPFPWWGHLVLGLGALAAAVIYLARAAAVEATAERLVSAAVFAALGAAWLVVAWLDHHPAR